MTVEGVDQHDNTHTLLFHIAEVGEVQNTGLLTHFLRPVEGGSELRSRFWFGYQIIDGKPIKMIPDGVSIPEIAPVSLLNHNVKEFANLAAILPSIYAEEKDNW